MYCLLWFTATDYPLVSSGHCIVSFDLRLLITLWYLRFTATDYPLVSSGHCIVCPSIYGYWLPFGIFWPFYCLSFDLRLLITLWYLLAIALSVLPFTATDYPLISSGHCIVCPSIYGYWLPFGFLDLRLLITLWYLLAIVLSVLWFTATDYPLVSSHFWPLYCLSFDLRLLITLWYLLAIVLSVLRFTATDYPLVSSGHCIVCPLIYGYWLPFDIFWPLYCLSFDLRLLITLWYLLAILIYGYWFLSSGFTLSYWLPFGIFTLLAIVLSVLRFTATDYPLVSSGHCIVCPSIYGYWLPSLYLRFTATDYPLIWSSGHCIVCPSIYGYWLPFGIFLPFYCLFLDLRLLITLWYLLAIVLSVLRFTATDYPLISSGHCIVCPSIYRYWLPFCILDLPLLITPWYLLAIVLSVLRFTATGYPLVSSGHCIVCPLIYGYWLPFGILDLRLLITPLVSSGHCIVCPLIYGYWLPFGIFWPLYCLSFDLRLLITLWYLLAIALSVLRFTATDYPLVSSGHFIVCPSIDGYWLPFDIFWPLHCLSFDLRLLITLWYLRFTATDYPLIS